MSKHIDKELRRLWEHKKRREQERRESQIQEDIEKHKRGIIAIDISALLHDGEVQSNRDVVLTAPAMGGKTQGRYDHDEVRCEQMAETDCDMKLPGEPRTCCVCVGHDCQEARAEREKHPARKSK